MSECYFNCGKKCTQGRDWACRQCNATYHYACTQPEPQMEVVHACAACGAVFDKVTVCFWATNTFEPMSVHERCRRGCTLDVTYVSKGRVVAVQPYLYTNIALSDTESHMYIKRCFPFVSRQITDPDELSAITKDWYRITRLMDKVKPLALYS